MTWDYRVLRRVIAGETRYAVHEVYYDDSGKPTSCTVDPVEPSGETLEELRRDCANYIRALDMPVLEYDSFGGESGQKETEEAPGVQGCPSTPDKSL